MSLFQVGLGVIIGVFVASHSPESAEIIRTYTLQLLAAAQNVYESGAK